MGDEAGKADAGKAADANAGNKTDTVTVNLDDATISSLQGIEAIDELYNTLASVTAEDIRLAADRYLQDDRRTVLILKGE